MKLTDHNEKVLKQFSDMMIERMQQMKAEDWQKGWIDAKCGTPINIDGKAYRGGNVFMLMLLGSMAGYEYPVYCTLNQANKLGAHVNKGEKAMPVIFWDFSITTPDGRHIKQDEYSAMPKAEQDKCMKLPFLKSYYVFNIAQTNLAEVQPERIAKLTNPFGDTTEEGDEDGMYKNQLIDTMLQNNSWYCPIHITRTNNAYYAPMADEICVPTKRQFKRHRKPELVYTDGQEFYSTLLHEMVHSTSKADRLNRECGGRFGSERYAKEELVAELGAARICSELGFASRALDNSAAYLDAWITTLKEEPTFILTVISDVEKAAQMILSKIRLAA